MNAIEDKFWIILLCVFVILYLYFAGMINYLAEENRLPYVLLLLYQHTILVINSLAIATVLGVLLGMTLSHHTCRKLNSPMLYLLALGQTIPALAVFAIMMMFFGIGAVSAILALTIISIFPIARNTIAGLKTISPVILDAAKGMGMSNLQILFMIKLRLAFPVILAGVRISLVINIGTATIAYVIGAGGLGDLIFTGIALIDSRPLVLGVILTILLAWITDTAMRYCAWKLRYEN